VVSLLLVANILNIGADLGAMGAAVEMLFGINPVPIILGIAVGSILLEVFIPYRSYVPLLQILVFALLSYVFTAFIVNVPWQEALKATVIPSFEFSKDSLMMIVAIFGTTISPYLFFWQSSQEVEEMRMKKGERPLKLEPAKAPAILRKLRWDTLGGMAFSNIITFFIILTTGATLHASGTIHIATAADAAKALEPLAGTYASCLFAIGIIGTGLLAIPVLAGSTAFGLGEALRLPVGLERPARRAKGFYTIIGLSSLLGLCMNFFGIDPIQALIAVAVINGVISVPLMAIMVRMSSDSRVMGSLTISRGLQILGWCATGIVGCASIAFFATW
jgi:Mn2+/Fe2+ NRAMP family transporter